MLDRMRSFFCTVSIIENPINLTGSEKEHCRTRSYLVSVCLCVWTGYYFYCRDSSRKIQGEHHFHEKDNSKTRKSIQ